MRIVNKRKLEIIIVGTGLAGASAAASLGGYAKTTPALIKFIKEFYQEHQILLDYVYTGKLLYGIFDLISKNYFPENATIIAVHTGGVMNANVFDLQQ